MSELLKTVLSLSLSGTLLLFIVLALKPLYKNKLSKRWQYYIWVLVLVRMLIPFAPETTIVGSAFQHLENINVETIQTNPSTNDIQADFDSDDSVMSLNGQPQAPPSNMETTPSISIQAIFSNVYENLWIVWAAIAFALWIRKITMYQSFIRFVKVGWTEVSDIEILNGLADTGETVGVKRPIELYTNPLISSPMLLGFFRPYIILPSIELDSTELAYIMRHELTHYKHLDMFYKWLVQITVCLHWFNPFAYLMAKEINKCCELSCDETIIRTMDKDEKKAYGDTLLNSLKAIGNYNDKLATVMLSEGAEQLKERLDAIMKFKKKSKTVKAITLVLTTMLCISATTIGAYAVPAINAETDEIISDLEQNPTAKEDIKRLTLAEVSNDMRSTISSCEDKTWYIIEGHERHYIYYNNLPHNYAYQYDPTQNSVKIVDISIKNIDIGKSTDNYVLLSVPISADLAISYNSKSVTYKTVLGVVSELQNLNANNSWSSMGGTDQSYTYSQQGYYQGDYIFELGWNLNTKAYDAYSDKSKVILSDGSTITVSFDKSCKNDAQDNAILADLKELVERLGKEYANSTTQLEKPLVVSVKYVGDSDLVKLAEEYYTKDELTSFSAIFSSLDASIQKEYITKIIKNGKTAFLSSCARNMKSDMLDYCAKETYQEGKIALFSCIAPYLSDDQKQIWIARASRDNKNTFFSVLTEE